MQYKPNVTAQINEKLDSLEETIEALNSEIAEVADPEIILEGFNKKVYEAINGLKEASSAAQEEQMNVELMLQRAAVEHQELLEVLLSFSEDGLQSFDRADLAPLLNRAKRKAQSVHDILFAGL